MKGTLCSIESLAAGVNLELDAEEWCRKCSASRLASVPEDMRGQPLTTGQFLRFMSLLVKANVALKQRVAQLEQQADAQGGSCG
ncbi:MAG: hypothetical protein WAM90_08700 [Rhodanobacter sp.]